MIEPLYPNAVSATVNYNEAQRIWELYLEGPQGDRLQSIEVSSFLDFHRDSLDEVAMILASWGLSYGQWQAVGDRWISVVGPQTQ